MKKIKSILYFFSFFSISLIINAVVCKVSTAEQATIYVTTTTGMLADATKQIFKGYANVTSIMGVGVDPHLYQPTRSDIALLYNASLIIANGLLLEGRMTEALTRISNASSRQNFKSPRIIFAGSLIDKSKLLTPEGIASSGHYDPHIWMDPVLWSEVVENLTIEIVRLYPSYAKEIRENSAEYQKKLSSLDQYAKKALSSIPKTSKILITAHDAFHYFARRYGLEVRSLQGISTESEASVRDIEGLVKESVNRNVKAVFVESTISQRNINALIEGASKLNHPLKIGGNLYSDAMGPPGTYEGTYLGMLDHNITTISRSLGGEAPKKGWQGLISVE
jgi:manganese/zinc/iron transport system substrate-binding protein